MNSGDSKLMVAIWMVTYNHETYIEQAIESVMMQKTSFSYKLFVGEDFSSDGTRDLCKKMLDKYPNTIELVLNDTNLGHEANGLKIQNICHQSQARYIAMLEGDDYWADPLKLQKQIDFLESNPEYSLSFTRFKFQNGLDHLLVDDKYGRFFKNNEYATLFDFEIFAKGWYGGLPTLVYRHSAFQMNVRLTYSYFRDIHLYTELLKNGKGICLNFFGSIYRIHEGGIYSSSDTMERARTGSLSYKELYLKNKSIPALKTKYGYFHKAYLKELLIQKHHFKAFIQILLFGFYTKDLGFVKTGSKLIIKATYIGKLIQRTFYRTKTKPDFPGSELYWENRYQSKKNSGSGSYGRLATFKADILNDFVAQHHIHKVIEFGCGDGHQLSLAKYPNYIGYDVSNKALDLCRDRFRDDATKEFYNTNNADYDQLKAELVLSLDVIYHLIEDKVFNAYMSRLFATATHYVIIYSSNYNERLTAHVKCRKFTNWIASHVSDTWQLEKVIKNQYPFDAKDPHHTSMADFYIYKKI